jgi:hypothetical protein
LRSLAVANKNRNMTKFQFAIVLWLGILNFQALALPGDERLSEIQRVVDTLDAGSVRQGVRIEPNAQLIPPAGSYQLGPNSFLIQYNPVFFGGLADSAKNFVLFHELGHIRLGHVALPFPGPDAAVELEFEADAFAAMIYMKIQGPPDAGLREFFQRLEERTESHPPGPERLRLIERFLH